MKNLAIFFLILFPSLAQADLAAGNTIPGQDVADVFACAKSGEPLTYVALGGSITQGGKGWIGSGSAGHLAALAIANAQEYVDQLDLTTKTTH